ncbi:PREDICTED: interleukin-12 receptor subunit beta-2-like, partial [Tinamus guttatus]
EAAAGSRITVSVYAVYPDGVSKPGSGQVTFAEGDTMREKERTEAEPEKSGFTPSVFSGPPLDNSDPTIMEIEELPVREEYKLVDVRRGPSAAVPESTAYVQSPAPATELVSDYRPQLSDGNLLGYVAANIYQSQPHALPPEAETNVFFRDYPSPVTYLWNAEGMEQQTFLLEKINLILNNNRSGQNHAFDLAREEQNTLLGNHGVGWSWLKVLPNCSCYAAARKVCDKGNMTANTASHVQPGANITLSCQLKQPKQKEQCKIAIFFNSSELSSNYGSSVSTRFLVRTYGKLTFTCKVVCNHRKKLICGIDIESGNPPDQPKNVLCIQYGTDSNPTCSWSKGRLTFINTTYEIKLSNETDKLCFLEENVNNKFGLLDLNMKLNFNSTYTVVVAASNELGKALSQPLVFMLIDIVKPHPPKFLVKFENSSATNCTVFWSDEAQAQHFRLRYRSLNSYMWNMVESLNSEKCNLYGLQPYTEYEFQVSCKIHPERGLWSNWRTFQTRTPEAVPARLSGVWYKKQDMDSQMQNISLFWKALSKSEARGKILQYTVTFQALNHNGKAIETDVTVQPSYSRVTPKMDYSVTITAQNSRGSSPPASLVTKLHVQDLPPPRNVSAIAMGNNSILVIWKPPSKSTAFLNGYIVEWIDIHRNKSLEPHLNWIKLLASNLSAVISEHIKDHVCYHIAVSALYQDRAGEVASVRGYSREKAPSVGPQMYPTPQTNGILVSWEEIPANQQMGCITEYNIYLQKKDSKAAPEVYAVHNVAAQRSFYIANLQDGQNYFLWMTASTAAGESPRGNSELVCLESAADWVTVALACCVVLLPACVCALPPARKALRVLLSVIVPQWYSKAIPSPANASWARNYTSTKGELSLPPSPFLPNVSSFEEPNITQVEETFVKTDAPVLQDRALPSCTDSSGNQDWHLESSFEKQESEYRPLPGMTDGDGYEQQLPYLYRRIVGEAPGQAPPASGYLALPAPAPPAYLPSAVLAPLTGAGQDYELDCSPTSVFPPTAFLTPVFSYGGSLTLDAVKINCASFTR